ncbi:MAG: hypothetical protein ABIP51_05265, partial [Bacteroidia bacterium]
HYCGGKLKDISLFGTGNEDGCCGNKKKSKGCCNEKSAFIKVKDNHFGGNNVKVFNIPIKSIPPPVFNQSFQIQNADISYTALNYHSPPVLYDNPLYLKHRVLII